MAKATSVPSAENEGSETALRLAPASTVQWPSVARPARGVALRVLTEARDD